MFDAEYNKFMEIEFNLIAAGGGFTC